MNQKIEGKIKLLTPMVHSEEQTGYSSKFRRLNFKVDDEFLEIPVLSGNSIRGVMRRLGANYLLNNLELDSRLLPDSSYYCLFSGGILSKGQKTANEPDMKQKIRAQNPFLSLFGTTVKQELLQGKLQVGMGIPICRETQDYTGVESKLNIFSMLQEISYTRKDDRETKESETLESEDKHQMKFTIETLLPGVEMVHEFILRGVNELEKSCFYSVLSELKSHPFLGGMSRIGHGQVEILYTVSDSDMAEYSSFVAENKGMIKSNILSL